MIEEIEHRLAIEIAERRRGQNVTASDMASRLMSWLTTELRKAKAEAWAVGYQHGQDSIYAATDEFPNPAFTNPYCADEVEGSEHEE